MSVRNHKWFMLTLRVMDRKRIRKSELWKTWEKRKEKITERWICCLRYLNAIIILFFVYNPHQMMGQAWRIIGWRYISKITSCCYLPNQWNYNSAGLMIWTISKLDLQRVYFVFTRNPFRRNKMTKEKAKKLKLKFPRRHAPAE